MNSWIENIFQVIRHLLNQSTNSTSINDNILMKVWSPMAMVLTLCLSGGVLTKIISPENQVINTFEEMVNSGLKVYVNNNSWIWWKFNGNTVWKIKLDENLSRVKAQIDTKTYDQLKNVKKR